MTRSLKPGCQWFKLLSLGVLGGAIVPLLECSPSLAQITPDATLGNEASVVSPRNNIRGLPGLLIEGGAIRGRNLFQSFQEFNVGNGQRVYFANPAGIEAILSRVTGRNPSNIFGTLGVNGRANLFLINPNGIVFGPNARLDIAGSFVATTADSLTFENGLKFSARNPEAPPLLTVTLRPGLPYGTNYQGNITNAGNLAVGAGQTLSLQGNAVTSTGALTTPGGTVQMLGDRISLLDNARIDVSGVGGGGTVLIGGDFQGKGEVPNASQTFVGPGVTIAANGLPTPHTPYPTPSPGGRVIIWSDNATQFNGTISARGAETGGNGGFVEVSGKQTLGFNGRVDTSAPLGKPGTLLLDPYDFVIDQPTTFTSNTNLQADNNITFNAPVTVTTGGLSAVAGNDIAVNSNIKTFGGNVTLDAKAGNVSISGAEIKTSPPEDFIGFAGSITISAGKQTEIKNSTLDARSNTTSTSDFTTIQISGQSVLLDQAYISATNQQSGFAGDIALSARDQFTIRNSRGDRTDQSPGLFSQGNKGRILIGQSDYFSYSPKTVTLDNAQLVTNNNTNAGNQTINAGDITVKATDSISLENNSILTSSTNRQGDAGIITLQAGSVALSRGSKIYTDAYPAATGNAGGVGIEAGSLSMSDGSVISTSTYTNSSASSVDSLSGLPTSINQSYAGAVVLFIDGNIRLDGGSNIFNNLENGARGNAGVVLIVAKSLSLLNGSQIQTLVRGQNENGPAANGKAGNILILLDESLEIIGRNVNPSAIFSSLGQGATGEAGNILIGAKSVRVRDEGRISTNNLGSGPAGNIFFFTRAVWLDNRAVVTSGSFDGQGGNIFLSVDGAIILGRNSLIATLALDGTFEEGAGNIAIGSGDLLREDRTDGKLVPRFMDRTLLVAGKTIRNNDIGAPGIYVDGGFIRVNASKLQDIAQRPLSNRTNDISAESAFGNPGEVVINSLNIFPSVKFTPLPDRTPRPQIAEGCDPRIRQETSRFILSGRGGLPPDAAEGLTQDTPIGAPSTAAAITPANDSEASSTTDPNWSAPARGWIRQPDGTILLTTYVTDPTVPPLPSPLQSRPQPPCNAPQP